jgi:uncharacterized membrane protein
MGIWLQSLVRREIADGVARGVTELLEREARHVAREESRAEAKEAPKSSALKPEVASVVRTAEPEPPTPEPVREAPKPATVQAQAATVVRAPSVSAPPPPAEPTLAEQWIEAAKGWLFGGNTIVRGGLILLFLGLSFLASYAANAGLFPIEFRLALVGAFGIGLLVIGLRKREERPSFGLALQGTGIAVLYLTVFAAGRIYTLLPPLASFGLMILFCALGCALALRQNSLLMAFASFLGGFAVPVLLGGESRSPVPLFAYYTILNVAILFIAWKRAWRPINLLGFFATFIMATLWGLSRYGPEHYLVCQIFLAISVGIYLATAILYAHNSPGRLGNATDQTLLFGPAIVGFGLQVGLVERFLFGAAFSALAFAALYTALAVWTFRRRDQGMRVLNECLIAIGVGFVTLAVPLALDVKWTSAAWALEGAGAFWIGMRQQRWMARGFGLALQGVAAMICLATAIPNVGALPLLNSSFLGALMVAVPLVLTAWWLREPIAHSDSKLAKVYAPIEFGVRHVVFLAGFLFVCFAIALEATRIGFGLPPLQQMALLMIGILAAMSGFSWFGRQKNWPVAIWPSWASLLPPALLLATIVSSGEHVLQWSNWLAMLIAMALHFDLLRRNDNDQGEKARPVFHWIHAAGVWLITAILADSLDFGIGRANLWDTSWAGVVFLVSVTAVLMGLTFWAGKPALRWPLVPHARAYLLKAGLPLMMLTYVGAFFTAILAQGVTDPLPYIPLFNPVDLSLGLALVALALWYRAIGGLEALPSTAKSLTGEAALVSGGILAFIIINSIWLRTAHHWLGVDWGAETLGRSATVQMGLSILWTLIAMGLMLFAQRRVERLLWLVGAGLLGVVVVKLFLVDLSTSQTWEKAVAFVGVGVIMLAIGYFVPIPPNDEKGDEKSDEKPVVEPKP